MYWWQFFLSCKLCSNMSGLSFFKTLAPLVYLGRFVVGPAISKAGQPAFRSRFFNRSNKLTTDCRMLRPCNKPKKGNYIQARSNPKPQTSNNKPKTTDYRRAFVLIKTHRNKNHQKNIRGYRQPFVTFLRLYK